MSKSLQFTSIDLLKYTEEIVDKQPSETEIQQIVSLYVTQLHPTHLAIEIPLDDNAELLAHGHVPSPLTIDEFTRVWITTIHDAGVNVYFRGTFCGIKNLYDFGYDKQTPAGTVNSALTDGKSTWLGRYYQWLTTNLSYLRPGDILGVMPEATNNAFNGNFFLQGANPIQEFLEFYTGIKQLSDEVTKTITPIYTGFSANVYRDIINEWIPAFLYDLVGTMVVDYYGDAQTPQEMEKVLNDLYATFRQPIFLSEWQVPQASVLYPTPDNNPQEFFAAFARLREKGMLIGLNYFDGLEYTEGVFAGESLNKSGQLLATFFAQGASPKIPLVSHTPLVIKPKPIQLKKLTIQKKARTSAEKPHHAAKKTARIKGKDTVPVTTKVAYVPIDLAAGAVHKKINYPFFITITVYMLLGAILTTATGISTHLYFGSLLLCVMIVYTLLVATIHAILIITR